MYYTYTIFNTINHLKFSYHLHLFHDKLNGSLEKKILYIDFTPSIHLPSMGRSSAVHWASKPFFQKRVQNVFEFCIV